MFKVGDKFAGEANGSVFEIIDYSRGNYVLSCQGEKLYATLNYLNWMLKAGGLEKIH